MNFNPNSASTPVEALVSSHYEELKGSQISDEILKANFKTIADINELLSRLNRKNGHGETVNVPGWGVQGINPITGQSCDEAFQFKSDKPRRKSDGNPLKYESPSGLSATPLFLVHPAHPDFWVTVFESVEKKIYITEGAKKAAYLMTLGLAAVSIPGVTNGQKQGHLHPLLKQLATIGREVAIVFDGDWRQKTGVALAMDTLGRLFCASGSVVSIVDIPSGSAKGIDDYGALHGNDAALSLLHNPLTFEVWRKPIAEMKAAKITGTELSLTEAYAEVDGLRAKNLATPFVLKELQRISKRSGIQPRELQAYYTAEDVDQQQKESLADSQVDFARILKLKDARIDVEEIFPSGLGVAMKSAGRVDRVNAARYIQALLPAIGTCTGSRIRLIDMQGATIEDSRYTVPIFYTVDVAPPSSGKTQANKRIMDPLDAMQSEDDRNLTAAKKRLRKLVAEAVRAKGDAKSELDKDIESLESNIENLRRCRIFNSGTPEGFTRAMARQAAKAGSVLQCDEILRLMSLGKYQGKSSDAEEWLLEAWNGASTVRTHLANDENSFLMDGQILSICGGTQPEMAKKMFNAESDPNGKSSRWLMMRSEPEADSWKRPTGVRVSIFGELRSFYEYLESLPEQYLTMDTEAQKFYWSRYEAYRKGAMVQADQNPAYSYYLGKCNNHLLRITTALHLHDCYYDRDKDIAIVTIDTLQRASQLLTFYIGQFRLIQSEYTPVEDNLAGLQLSCYQYLQSKGESITAYKLAKSWHRKKIGCRNVEVALDQLVELGHAVKDGKDYTFCDKNASEPVIDTTVALPAEIEAVFSPEEAEEIESEVYEYEYIPEEFIPGDTVKLTQSNDPNFDLESTGLVQGIPDNFPDMRDVAWLKPNGNVTESRHHITHLIEMPF